MEFNPAYLAGMIFGCLLATFLVSQLFFWLTRRWAGGITRILLIDVLAGIVCVVLGGFGMANGGPFQAGTALTFYGLAQLAWLAFDLVAETRRGKKLGPSPSV